MCYDWGVTRKEDNNMASGDMARRIKELRKERNMTLEDVAKIVGVGKSTVRKWETGMIENMRRDKIAALAKALGTTPMALMGWGEEEEQKKNDILSDIILKMRTDDTFMSVVENLYKLDKDKLETINQMLNTLFK
jgi:transcriptional regulator with XRE-family HTH domain